MHELADRIRGAVPAGNGSCAARPPPGSAGGRAQLHSARRLPCVVFAVVGCDLALAVRPLKEASPRTTSGVAGGHFVAGHESEVVVAHAGCHGRATVWQEEAGSRAHRGRAIGGSATVRGRTRCSRGTGLGGAPRPRSARQPPLRLAMPSRIGHSSHTGPTACWPPCGLTRRWGIGAVLAYPSTTRTWWGSSWGSRQSGCASR
jgi:hypothetical protein